MNNKRIIIGVTIGITAAILWSVVFINVLNSMAGIGIGVCLGISFGISGSLIFSKNKSDSVRIPKVSLINFWTSVNAHDPDVSITITKSLILLSSLYSSSSIRGILPYTVIP